MCKKSKLKKYGITFFTIVTCLLLLNKSTTAQQIDKKFVVLEIGTGTWCWACPFASIEAKKLMHQGHKVLLIKNSFEDEFETTASLSRINYYNTSVFPETFFNGHKIIAGVPNSSNFLELYEQEINRKTSFYLKMSYKYVDNNYMVEVKSEKIHDFTGENIVLHLFLVENHIKHFWQGFMPEIAYSNRKMYPSPEGTKIDFTANDSITHVFNLPLDTSINYDNSELVAVLQNNSTKEILQATKVNLGYMYGDNNIGIDKIVFPEKTNCESTFAPSVIIRNRANNTLKSAVIESSLNSNNPAVIEWTGSLLPNESTQVELSAMNITGAISDTIKIVVKEPNDQPDDNFLGNEMSMVFYNEVASPIKLTIYTNRSSENFYWQIFNNEEILNAGSNYFEGDTITEFLHFLTEDCVEFRITDSDQWGSTEVILNDAYGNILFHTDELILDSSKSIFFRPKIIPPFLTCNISDNQTDVSVNDTIILNFSEPIRNINDTEIQSSELADIVSIKKNIIQTVPSNITINSEYNQISIMPNNGFNYSTSYAVHVKNLESFNNVAFNDTIINFVTESQLGLNESKSSVCVFPNPAKKYFYVDSKIDDIVKIYNVAGKLLLKKEIKKGRTYIDIGNLQMGVYIINTKITNIKLIID